MNKPWYLSIEFGNWIEAFIRWGAQEKSAGILATLLNFLLLVCIVVGIFWLIFGSLNYFGNKGNHDPNKQQKQYKNWWHAMMFPIILICSPIIVWVVITICANTIGV